MERDLGAYVRTNGLIAPRILAQCFAGPYRVPNVPGLDFEVDVRGVAHELVI